MICWRLIPAEVYIRLPKTVEERGALSGNSDAGALGAPSTALQALSNRIGCQAGMLVHGLSCSMIALAVMRSFLIAAVMATLGALPLARRFL